MYCAAHPGVEAPASCHVCHLRLCPACEAYDVDGAPACEPCGRAEDARSRALGTAAIALTAIAYLGTVALSVAFFKPRPIVGGVAALVTILTGRGLASLITLPAVTPKPSRPAPRAPDAH